MSTFIGICDIHRTISLFPKGWAVHSPQPWPTPSFLGLKMETKLFDHRPGGGCGEEEEDVIWGHLRTSRIKLSKQQYEAQKSRDRWQLSKIIMSLIFLFFIAGKHMFPKYKWGKSLKHSGRIWEFGGNFESIFRSNHEDMWTCTWDWMLSDC